MGTINLGRLLLGGIVGGIVGNILGFLADGVILAPQWAASMKTLGRPEFAGNQFAAFTIIGLVYGIFVVWLYAAIRPRFGAGPKTAVYAGLAAWASQAIRRISVRLHGNHDGALDRSLAPQNKF